MTDGIRIKTKKMMMYFTINHKNKKEILMIKDYITPYERLNFKGKSWLKRLITKNARVVVKQPVK